MFGRQGDDEEEFDLLFRLVVGACVARLEQGERVSAVFLFELAQEARCGVEGVERVATACGVSRASGCALRCEAGENSR